MQWFPGDEPVHRIHVEKTPSSPSHHNAVGVLLKFNAGPAELERIQAFIDRLAERGICQAAKAQTYNADYGSPEFYIP